MNWERLRYGHIVGIVDSYGAVHSKFTENVEFHEALFPPAQCKWRWSHSKSLWWITAEARPDEEQEVAIQRHITRKYGLKWWENGHHDIDHLMKKWGEVK
jgi:hypothetical protein